MDQLPWSLRVPAMMVSFASGLIIISLGVFLYEKIGVFVTARADRKRILGHLDQLGENVTRLNIKTAAEIWAGTREEGDIQRHIYFRCLKDAVNNGKLFSINLEKKQKANIKTAVDVESLKAFWRSKGVID